MFPLTLFVSASDIYKSWIMRFSKWIKAKRNRDFRHTVDTVARSCQLGLGGIRPCMMATLGYISQGGNP